MTTEQITSGEVLRQGVVIKDKNREIVLANVRTLYDEAMMQQVKNKVDKLTEQPDLPLFEGLRALRGWLELVDMLVGRSPYVPVLTKGLPYLVEAASAPL